MDKEWEPDWQMVDYTTHEEQAPLFLYSIKEEDLIPGRSVPLNDLMEKARRKGLYINSIDYPIMSYDYKEVLMYAQQGFPCLNLTEEHPARPLLDNLGLIPRGLVISKRYHDPKYDPPLKQRKRTR